MKAKWHIRREMNGMRWMTWCGINYVPLRSELEQKDGDYRSTNGQVISEDKICKRCIQLSTRKVHA